MKVKRNMYIHGHSCNKGDRWCLLKVCEGRDSNIHVRSLCNTDTLQDLISDVFHISDRIPTNIINIDIIDLYDVLVSWQAW